MKHNPNDITRLNSLIDTMAMATARQKRAIARLATFAGIKEPIEERQMTVEEARDEIYRLRQNLRSKGHNIGQVT